MSDRNPKTKQPRLTPAQYRLLDKSARGDGYTLTPREVPSLNVLLRDRLVEGGEYSCGITGSGQRYLDTHIIKDGKIVECERRPRIAASTIKEDYGFTDKLIRELLPEPMLVENPHYKRAAPMRLWYDDEIDMLSRQPDIAGQLADVLAKREKRKAGARKAVETKKKQTALVVDEAISQIRVKRIDPKRARRNGVRDRQDWYDATEQWDRDAYSADEATKDRWMVNYIRHNLTDYDEGLWRMSGMVGCHDEYARYKNAVLDRIAQAYPECEHECNRQKVGGNSHIDNWDGPVEDKREWYRQMLEENRRKRYEDNSSQPAITAEAQED